MLKHEKLRFVLVFSLIAGQAVFANDSKLKTELEPATLKLEIGLSIESVDDLKRYSDQKHFDQSVRQLRQAHDPATGNLENTWVVSVLLPHACGFLGDLTDENSELSKKVRITDQISFNDTIAGISYCNRFSVLEQGTVNFIEDYVSQDSWTGLKLATLGFPLEESLEEKCRLSNGRYSYENEDGELNCLDYPDWYYVDVYDHAYRDMNGDGYLDLVLFTVLNGSWSGPPERSTRILTKTSPIEGWRIVLQSTASLIPGGSNGDSQFDKFEISEFPELSKFKTVDAFQQSIDDYVESCIDQTYGNTRAIPCFVGYELWDRELNIYYTMLLKRLPKEDAKELRSSQRLWLQDRDKTIEFNTRLLDRHYKGVTGTMYSAMRANNAADAITPMIKQRALLLKSWFEMEELGPVSEW